MFVLLLRTAGDKFQGIKRKVLELAYLVPVNKAEGELTATAQRSAAFGCQWDAADPTAARRQAASGTCGLGVRRDRDR
jgi:putative protein kinase ArgK-like GTPase of G3E family